MEIREHSPQKDKGGYKAMQAEKDVSRVSFGNTEIASELEKINWGKNTLTENIEAAFFNISVSFLQLRPYCECLVKAAEIFDDAVGSLSCTDLKGFVSISLFARAYGCFFGSVRLSCSGQTTETWVLLRACLENSLYAFYIDDNPKFAKVWVDRHESEAHKKNCRKVFGIGDILKALEAKSQSIAKEAKDCYDASIDWGAHPNERSLFSNLEEKQDNSGYSLNILNTDETLTLHSLCTVLSTASLVFKIFALIYPDELKRPNLAMKIDKLDKRTQSLLCAALDRMKDIDEVAKRKAR